MLTPKLRFLLATLLLPVFIHAQVTIKGKVTSGTNPDGLPRVSVLEKGTNNGVTSNDNGEFTISVKDKNAVLVFSYLGMEPYEVAVGNQTFISTTLKEESVSPYAEVTVTAGRRPTRKLETTTSVEIINAKALKIIKPEGIAEAITAAPGIYVNTSQGRRGSIVTRGFPDGGNPLGGLDYTGILLDGLPSFGSTGRLPEAGFGFDLNVEKVEVVRGSTATLFGRASAAGAINVISKTGGETTARSFKFTSYNKLFKSPGLNYRFDFNSNGMLFKKRNWRFNIGGWLLNDNGFKNTGFNDNGFQVRGNIDYLLPKNKGSVRFYMLGTDYVFQNLTDIPADMNSMKVAGKWKPEQTLQNFNSFYSRDYTVFESGGGFPTRQVFDENGKPIVRSVGQAMKDNSYGKNFHVGTTIIYKMPKGMSIEERFRYQDLKSGTKYSFSLPSFYRNNSVTRLLLDGDANDVDAMNEFRFKQAFEVNKVQHEMVFGNFMSRTHLKPLTYSFVHTLNPENADSLKFAPLAPPFVNTPWSGTNDFPRGSVTRNGDYIEDVSSLFAGDEIKFNDKLKVTLGLRYDWVKLDMKERKKPYDKTLTREEKHHDWSGSIGFNYLLNKSTAVYGNLNRAFRAPDYTAYTSLEWISFTDRRWLRVPTSIDKNETIVSTELGYRTSINDFGFDVSLFYTKINNRLSRIFENGIVVSRPFGSNRISGTELSAYFIPSGNAKGLSIRTNVTYQNAIFTDFKLPVERGGVLGNTATQLNINPAGDLYGNELINEGNGNYSIKLDKKKLPSIPNFIWNSFIGYSHKFFGIDLSSNYNGKRFIDATNVLKYNNLMILNAGTYFKIPLKGTGDLRLGVQAKNLTNRNDIQNIPGLTASDVALGQKQKSPNWTDATAGNRPIWGQGYVQLPRRFLIYLSFDF
jgi:iron complex outermembrane recepter protein